MIHSSHNSHELYLLQTAYEVGRYIHTFVTEDSRDGSGKVVGEFAGRFRVGPNPTYSQTKEGLVLEMYYGAPARIHTPYGHWRIVGGDSGGWERVFKAIKEPLGLELYIEGKKTSYGDLGPHYAITKWKEKIISWPVYKEGPESISFENFKTIWNEFSKDKQGISGPYDASGELES